MDETDEKDKKTGFRKWPTWKKVVAIVGALIIVLIVVAYSATSGVAKVSNEFLKDLQSTNADGAYSLFSKEAVAATDKTAFKDTVDKAGPILNTKAKMTGREVKGETGQAGTGKVTYEIAGTDNNTYTVTINLVKEDGKWKVVNFESTLKK